MSSSEQQIITCPICRLVSKPAYLAKDGGSNVCPNCGPWHLCKDCVIVKGSPGPMLCSVCQDWTPDQEDSFKSTWKVEEAKPWVVPEYARKYMQALEQYETTEKVEGDTLKFVDLRQTMAGYLKDFKNMAVAECNGCATKIYRQPGQRFKCQQCPDFDFCSTCVKSKQHDNTHNFIDYHAEGADLV